MKKISAIVFALAAFASAICAQPSIEVIESPALLHCNDTVAVWSPGADAALRACPTLILMHGYGGKWSDWGSNTDLQALCNRTGWRIICPDGFHDSWYMDNADPAQMQWRSFFWKECYPALDAKYGLDPQKTFVAGLSMGGHGAMSLFLDHPELFRGAGSMSGVLDLRYSSGSKEQIAKILGRKSIEKCDDQSAVYRLERLAALGPEQVKTKLLVIGCGTEDNTFYPASRLFEAKCRELGINHTSFYSRGMHRWPFWTYLLPHYITFFDELMLQD